MCNTPQPKQELLNDIGVNVAHCYISDSVRALCRLCEAPEGLTPRQRQYLLESALCALSALETTTLLWKVRRGDSRLPVGEAFLDTKVRGERLLLKRATETQTPEPDEGHRSTATTCATAAAHTAHERVEHR